MSDTIRETFKHEFRYNETTKQGLFNGGRNKTAKMTVNNPFPSRLCGGLKVAEQPTEENTLEEPGNVVDNTEVESSETSEPVVTEQTEPAIEPEPQEE